MSTQEQQAGSAGIAGAGVALVIGLTIHGLAVARALKRRGVEVHALAQVSGRRPAATYTRFAHVHLAEGLNSDRLIDQLLALSPVIPGSAPIVLFPTSDRMVGAIARNWSRLQHRYALSWAHCRDLVLHIQSKDGLPALAERAGILHPRSRIVTDDASSDVAFGELSLPIVVKPIKPLSRFKALIVGSAAELRDLVTRYRDDLPFVAQEFVAGGDGTLYACTMYFDHGRELCAFTSRKLAASPPGLGQGTVFVSEDVPEIRELSRKLLAGLDISGPVAVEFKRDPSGRYWMIEANVGRTEYCVDLVIQSGVDLPAIEYAHALGRRPDPELTVASYVPRGWFDTDKDPLCYLKHRRRVYQGPGKSGAPVFPFAGTGDTVPWLVSSYEQCISLAKRGLSVVRSPEH